MASIYQIEALDRCLRDLCKKDEPPLEHVDFGGKIVIFGGDFRQTLPTVRHASEQQIINVCINRSMLKIKTPDQYACK